MVKLKILLVEDNAVDALLLREAMQDQDFISKIYHVPDGAKAISF